MNSWGYQNRKDLTKLKSSKKPRDSLYTGVIRRIHEETREPDMYNVHVRIQKLYRIPSFKRYPDTTQSLTHAELHT